MPIVSTPFPKTLLKKFCDLCFNFIYYFNVFTILALFYGDILEYIFI